MKTVTRSPKKINQREIRSSIDLGPQLGQVTTVTDWYRQGKFTNEDQALGAFELAYQQGMDGMGKTVREWMGMSDEELNVYLRDNRLPPMRKQKKRGESASK